MSNFDIRNAEESAEQFQLKELQPERVADDPLLIEAMRGVISSEAMSFQDRIEMT